MNDDDLRRRVREALDSVQRPAPGLLRRCAEAVRRDRGRRLPVGLAWVAAVVLAFAVVAGTLLQHELSRGTPGPVQSPSPQPTPGSLLYTLTAGNQVVALDRATLAQRWRVQAAGAPSSTLAPGQLMGLSADRSTLYVLPPADDAGASELHLFDAATGRAGPVLSLAPPGGARYRALAVDPRSGLVYLVGQDQSRVLVSVVDPVRRATLGTVVTRTAPPKARLGSDKPLQAQVSADGSRLYYSYGGGDAAVAGIDWVELGGGTPTPCHPATQGTACIPGSGGSFALVGDHLVFSDTSPSPQIVETTLDGTAPSRHPSGLGGATPALLALPSGRVVVLGDCAGLGGLDVFDPAGGGVSATVTPAPQGAEPDANTVCGVRPALLGGQSLAVSRLGQGRAGTVNAGELDVVDLGSGRITRRGSLPADAVDLLAP